jgi:hypothetical protein
MQSENAVFISYAHQDVTASRVAGFTQFLHDCLPSKISLLLDRKLLGIGKNIPSYMQYLENCPAVIILMTPDYKRRTENAIGGVFSEFEIIRSRVLNENDEFLCLPVLFEGTPESAVPTLFEDDYYEKFTMFHPRLNYTRQKYYLSDSLREEFIPRFIEIARVIESRIKVRSVLPRYKYEEMLELLFAKTKITREWLILHPEFCNHLFVDTHSYTRVKNQNAVFIIGRKGSGKSTIANTLPQLEHGRYKACIAVLADHINLLSTYQMIDHDKVGKSFDTLKHRYVGRTTEFTQLNPTQFLFKYAWLGTLYICFAKELCELGKQNKLNATQKDYYSLLDEEFKKFTFKQFKNIEPSKYFTLASVAFAEFWDNMVTQALDLKDFSSVVRYIESNVNEERYLQTLLSEPLLNVIREIVCHCDRHVLITLDDFDSVFSIFRNSLREADGGDISSHSNILKTLESSWIQALMLLVLELKGCRKGWCDPAFKRVDFCITIPRDSYARVIRSDRDAFLDIEYTSDLEWTGVYLARMLLMRLCYMYGEAYDESKDVFSELNRVSVTFFRKLPWTMRYEFNGERISVALFCYVLRHTFWRPRDVLKYYAALMTAAMSCAEEESLSVEQIRLIVGITSKVILKTEFIGELKEIIPNLEKIINQFRKSSQILSNDEVFEKLKGIDFNVMSKGTISEFREKLRILYEIGFLGLQIPKDTSEVENTTSLECFYFNEGLSIFDSMAKYSFDRCFFLIHPIFVEELQINYKNNKLILHWDEDYLKKNHIVRMAVVDAF